MLRIYNVCLDMVKAAAKCADVIGKRDGDLARQLRRASASVVLNVAEGAGTRDGRRRTRYGDALGSAFETQAALDAAEVIGYLAVPDELRGQIGHIIAVLTKLTKPKK
jgi:four helix bundle protein